VPRQLTAAVMVKVTATATVTVMVTATVMVTVMVTATVMVMVMVTATADGDGDGDGIAYHRVPSSYHRPPSRTISHHRVPSRPSRTLSHSWAQTQKPSTFPVPSRVNLAAPENMLGLKAIAPQIMEQPRFDMFQRLNSGS